MKHIAIGPGALGYFALLGALDKLHVDGKLSDLESISGASAGALAACMAIYTKFDFREALKMSMKVPLSKLKPQIKNLFQTYGLVSQETMREMITDVIQPMTFAELYKLNPIKLHIAAFCIELNKTFYFSIDTTPTMSIIDALSMSIAVPFLFSSFKYGPWNYFDGGTVESSPCGHLIGQKNDDVLILILIYKDTYDVNNFTDYLSFVFNTYLKMRRNYPFPTLHIDLSTANVLDFGISDNIKLQFYLKGYNYFHS
jgi:predicted acylesterase/phospholipase RssA